MFGYVQVNQPELKIREFETYRSYYCGLCYTLKRSYGRTGQLLLNYDMTFLAILLAGLYEPEETMARRRCLPHPAVPHKEITGPGTRYAADMTILLSYIKAVDDWRDEHSHAKRAAAMMLYPHYREIAGRYPGQADALRRSVRNLTRMEREGCKDPDLVSAQTGNFLGEIFAWHEDLWKDDLREMGFYLGKFIYFMDAADDYRKDRKSGSYNVLRAMNDSAEEEFTAGSPLEMQTRMILTDNMARCCRAFERLPVLKNASIIRNILYSGVWGRYRQLTTQKSQKKNDGFQSGKI